MQRLIPGRLFVPPALRPAPLLLPRVPDIWRQVRLPQACSRLQRLKGGCGGCGRGFGALQPNFNPSKPLSTQAWCQCVKVWRGRDDSGSHCGTPLVSVRATDARQRNWEGGQCTGQFGKGQAAALGSFGPRCGPGPCAGLKPEGATAPPAQDWTRPLLLQPPSQLGFRWGRSQLVTAACEEQQQREQRVWAIWTFWATAQGRTAAAQPVTVNLSSFPPPPVPTANYVLLGGEPPTPQPVTSPPASLPAPVPTPNLPPHQQLSRGPNRQPLHPHSSQEFTATHTPHLCLSSLWRPRCLRPAGAGTY